MNYHSGTNNNPKFYKKVSVTFIIFLIAGSIGCYIRLYPLRNYTSNEAWDKASLLVINTAMRTVRARIRAEAGQKIPLNEQNRLATKRINTILSQDKKNVKRAILKAARTIDQRNPPKHNFPYLLASDSYYYYDLTQSIKDTGRISPEIKGSKYFHPKMAAPDGYWEPLNLHAFVGFGIYKILSFFEPRIPLMFAVSFTPLVLMLLALIPFLITARHFQASDWAVMIASVYYVTIHIFLKRSTFAWYDNDPYNVLFPMTLMMILSFGFRAKTRQTQIFSGIALAFGLTFYSLFWQGWVFIATILAASGLAVFLFDLFRRSSPDRKATGRIFLSFILTTLLGIAVVFGWRELFILFQEGWQALLGFFKAKLSVWPDTYIAVGELKKASFGKIVDLTGGIFFFILAAVGAVSGIRRLWSRDGDTGHNRLILPIIIFALAGLLVSWGAQRFTLLCVTPLTLLFLLGIDEALSFFAKQWNRTAGQRLQKWLPAAFILITGLCLIPRIAAAEKSMPKLLDPLYNSTWEKTLTELKNSTPENAIINSWWPPGHFIKAVADRRVTFDGATINDRQAYWLANALMATSEDEALDFLRLLNNSGNRAVDLLLKHGMTDPEAAGFLKHIIHLPKSEALAWARAVLNDQDQAAELIALTHGHPPPTYLLISNEMVENLLLYPFVARWNFEKADYLNRHPELKKNIPSSRAQEYIDFLWDIAGGQPKISGFLSPVSRQNGILVFEEGLTIDLNTQTCRIQSVTYGTGVPSFLLFEDAGRVVQKALPGANLPYSVVVGKRHGKYQALMLETPLAESFLVRLYFWGDTGLKHVKRIISNTNLTRQTQIDVFEIKVTSPF